MNPTLTLQGALSIVQATLAAAREAGLRPLSAVVLDGGGHVKACLREDGAGHYGFAIATAKAAGVLGFNVGASRALAEAFGTQPGNVAALAGITGGFLPIAGGVVIRDADGQVIGAAAAAGGMPDQDEQAVLSGLKNAGFH